MINNVKKRKDSIILEFCKPEVTDWIRTQNPNGLDPDTHQEERAP